MNECAIGVGGRIGKREKDDEISGVNIFILLILGCRVVVGENVSKTLLV